MTLAERLDQNSVVDGACRRWTGSHNHKGYGYLSIDGRRQGAHRAAYELWVGPIPDGLEIDHLCCVRDCIEPNHLEAVTHAENVRRTGERRTHCKRGHEFTPENTRIRAGKRLCRTCRCAWKRQWKQLRKERELNGATL